MNSSIQVNSSQQQYPNPLNQLEEITEQEAVRRYRESLLNYTYNSFLSFKQSKEAESQQPTAELVFRDGLTIT